MKPLRYGLVTRNRAIFLSSDTSDFRPPLVRRKRLSSATFFSLVRRKSRLAAFLTIYVYFIVWSDANHVLLNF